MTNKSVASSLSEFLLVSSQSSIEFHSPEEAYVALCRLYDRETERLQKAYKTFKGLKDFDAEVGLRIKGFYPKLRIKVDHRHINLDPSLSHAAFKEEGIYELVMSNPRSYKDFLGQLSLLALNSPGILFEVGLSNEEIPLHYAMRDTNFNLDGDRGMTPPKAEVARRIFYRRNPTEIHDYVSSDETPKGIKLLLPYNAQRFDHARTQFFYYTRTPFEALQPFVIFSNYAQYVEELYNYGLASLKEEFNSKADQPQAHAIAVVRTGYPVTFREGITNDQHMEAIQLATEMKSKKGAQMPACHVLMSDGKGISMINTGVGGPNAVNIADLVSVKRQDAWFMAGHAAGLSPTFQIGDYVFAEGYYVNPMMVNERGTGFEYDTIKPIISAPSSEIVRALKVNIEQYAAKMGTSPDMIFRTAPVVSTDYRFWERFDQVQKNLRDTHAAALDMETAWLALKAREQRIPFGGFLKISDMPYHDRPKAPASTDGFFGEGLGAHLGLIINAIGTLKAEHMNNMHSRKIRPVYRAHVLQ